MKSHQPLRPAAEWEPKTPSWVGGWPSWDSHPGLPGPGPPSWHWLPCWSFCGRRVLPGQEVTGTPGHGRSKEPRGKGSRTPHGIEGRERQLKIALICRDRTASPVPVGRGWACLPPASPCPRQACRGGWGRSPLPQSYRLQQGLGHRTHEF